MLQDHAVLRVTIRLDPVPGTNHTPEQASAWLQSYLDRAIIHYNPSVTLLHSVRTEGLTFEEDAPKVEKLTTENPLSCVDRQCDLMFKSLVDIDASKQRVLHPKVHAGSYEFMHVIKVVGNLGIQDFFAAETLEAWESDNFPVDVGEFALRTVDME